MGSFYPILREKSISYIVTKASNHKLRKLRVQFIHKHLCSDRLAHRLRHRVQKERRVDVQIPHLDHLNGQRTEKLLPRRQFLRTIRKARKVKQIQRHIDIMIERIAQ